MNKRSMLFIVSILLILGGVVRILATKTLFDLFLMGELWIEHPFFIYIYRLLGAVIVWLGIVLLICSKDLLRYRAVIQGSIIGAALFFATSFLTGFLSGLQMRFFIVDGIFALFLVFLFVVTQRE